MLVYTDGSCVRNRYGGWAFCIVGDDEDTIVFGSEDNTTNNRMELRAVLELLEYLEDLEEDKGNKLDKNLEIQIDSLLTMNCATKKWKRNKNLDLWKQYDKLSKNYNINFVWVKGHSGDEYNEIVDKYARDEAESLIL